MLISLTLPIPYRLAPPVSSMGFWHGVLRRFEMWNVPCFESSRSPTRQRVGAVAKAVMVCFVTKYDCGIDMIEEEIQPFDQTEQPSHPTPGFQQLDSRVVNLWRVSSLIGFGVL